MGENDWVIGVAFSFASSVLSCLGLIFQKYAHNQNQALPDDQKYPVVAGIVCSPCWWASFIMMGLFPFPFDFFAYSFAAQSLVAPFAGLTLIMNQFFAPLILKEKLYRIDVYASIVVFIGTTLTTVTGNHEDESYTLEDLLAYFRRTEFVVGASLLVFLMVMMWFSLHVTDPLRTDAGAAQGQADAKSTRELDSEDASASITTDCEQQAPVDAESACEGGVVVQLGGTEQSGLTAPSSSYDRSEQVKGPTGSSLKRNRVVRALAAANFSARPFYYGFVSGGFGALQNIFFKSLGVLMKGPVFDGGESSWNTWYPYVFIICVIVFAVSQLSILNKGMSRYDAVLVFPLYNASYIFLSVSMGALYYGEFGSFTTRQWVLFPLGVVITIFGIIMFIFKPRESSSELGKSGKPATTKDSSSAAGGAAVNEAFGQAVTGGDVTSMVGARSLRGVSAGASDPGASRSVALA